MNTRNDIRLEWVLNPVGSYGIPKAPHTYEQQLYFRTHNIAGAQERVITPDHLCRYAFAAQHGHGKCVFDIGCGNGYGLDIISRQASFAVGFDRDIASLHEARTAFSATVVASDFTALSFRSGVCDVAIGFEVVEHVVDPLSFLQGMLYLVREGGSLFFSTPNRAINSPGWMIPYNPFHIQEWDITELQHVLEQIGCKYTIYGEFPVRPETSYQSYTLPSSADADFIAHDFMLSRGSLEMCNNFVIELKR